MRRVAALLVLLAFAGCVGGGEVTGDLRNVGSVTMTFKVTPAHAKVGQSVRFGFRLVNNAGRDEELRFPSGQRYDFWATLGSREVWRWSTGRVFVQEITRATILPQSGISYAEPWTPERPGNYIVHGELRAERYDGELTGRLRVE